MSKRILPYLLALIMIFVIPLHAVADYNIDLSKLSVEELHKLQEDILTELEKRGNPESATAIRTHNSKEDEIKFLGIDWLTNADTVLNMLFEKYDISLIAFENPRIHYNLCDTLASWSYLVKSKDESNPLIWDLEDGKIGFISVNCINDPSVAIKETTYDDMRVYSVDVCFWEDKAKANKMKEDLDSQYGPGVYEKSASYDFRYRWTDRNNNYIWLSFNKEYYYPLELRYECGDVKAFAEEEKAKEAK